MKNVMETPQNTREKVTEPYSLSTATKVRTMFPRRTSSAHPLHPCPLGARQKKMAQEHEPEGEQSQQKASQKGITQTSER